MIVNSKHFAIKYATIFTSILAAILLFISYTYLNLLSDIDKAKLETALEQQAYRVIVSMQRYNNDEGIYYFPKNKEYPAALYDKQFREKISSLTFSPSSFSPGFHHQEKYYYLIYDLPNEYYFGQKYLLVSTKYRANNVYMIGLLLILLILITLFLISLFLLKKFSKPFKTLNNKLDSFIKDSMHEINTPLSIINLNSDLFANKYGDNKYLQRIKSASKTLATIYDDMDYLIKKGRMKHKEQNINISEFLQNRVDYFKSVANLKEINIEVEIEENIIYLFSKTKLQRIIDNTLSNAIKYSYDHKPIKVKLYNKNELIYFSVRDYGIGIEDVNKIFSRYFRANESKGGFGIGLNIVKEIIDKEGIKLEVKSELKKGSYFIYSFPKK